MEKKIRILDSAWHLAHQAEMLKFPWAEFDWLYNHRRQFSEKVRIGMEDRFKWVPVYEPGKYDVAILHLDQQCIEEGILAYGKGSVYTQMNEVIQDIPKIVIMHGTPYYPEVFPNPQDIINKVKELIGDNYLVVNSHSAAKQWGFGHTIVHGMDPKDWWDLPKEPRVVTMISPGGLPAYYDRSFLEYVKEGLRDRDIEHCHITVDWEAKNFDDYRNFLGRSLLYFNPTRESPMPRARTEAMMSGCCVITTPTQDADTFIKDSVNGFLVPRNPEYVINLIEKLLQNYDLAVKVGQEGKKTALELFNWDRYERDWFEFINTVIKDWHEKNAGKEKHV
ncbi:MAG: glycosyltransferase [Candidatus Levybacteria bacterium]|nr:glycosyltransferase [Candidatus Levybacteria bacterium]